MDYFSLGEGEGGGSCSTSSGDHCEMWCLSLFGLWHLLPHGHTFHITYLTSASQPETDLFKLIHKEITCWLLSKLTHLVVFRVVICDPFAKPKRFNGTGLKRLMVNWWRWTVNKARLGFVGSLLEPLHKSVLKGVTDLGHETLLWKVRLHIINPNLCLETKFWLWL